MAERCPSPATETPVAGADRSRQKVCAVTRCDQCVQQAETWGSRLFPLLPTPPKIRCWHTQELLLFPGFPSLEA